MRGLLCLLVSLLLLTGCSTTPTRVEVKLELTPDYLMESPCDAQPGSGTVENLAAGYIANTRCLHLHKELLQKQKDYKRKVESIYVK